MGVFDKFDDSKKIGSNRHKPGRYLERVDLVEDTNTQDGRAMLKINMTVAKVLADHNESEPHKVDDETGLVFTRDKFGYFERDCRSVLRATLDLTLDEANELTGPQMAKTLLKDKAITTMLVEVRADRRPKKNPKPDEDPTFVKAVIVRSLSEAQAKQELGEQFAKFFPNGITALKQPAAAGKGK